MHQVTQMRVHTTNRKAMSAKFTSGLLCTILLLVAFSSIHQTGAIQIAQRRLSPTFTLTFVYGDKDAMKTHIEALQFCRGLGRPRADAEISYETPAANQKTETQASPAPDGNAKTTDSSVPANGASTASATEKASATENSDAPSTINPPPQLPIGHTVVESDGTRFRSDLVSVHDGHMVNELMRWVLNIDKRQFWIGGVVKMIEHNFQPENTIRHLLQLWTDRTPSNFRFLHYDNPMLASMQPNDLACVSVDYASGKWGLHNCDTPMYFVCETVDLGKTPSEQTAETVQPAGETKISPTGVPALEGKVRTSDMPAGVAVTMPPVMTTVDTNKPKVLPASITQPPKTTNGGVKKTEKPATVTTAK